MAVALSNIASAHAILTGKMTALSIEQVLECFANTVENPNVDDIFKYVEKNPLETAIDYPMNPTEE